MRYLSRLSFQHEARVEDHMARSKPVVSSNRPFILAKDYLHKTRGLCYSEDLSRCDGSGKQTCVKHVVEKKHAGSNATMPRRTDELYSIKASACAVAALYELSRRIYETHESLFSVATENRN